MKGCNGRSCGCYIFPFLCAEAELLGNTFNLLDSIALLFVFFITEDESGEMPFGGAFPHQLRRGKSSGLQRFRQVSIFLLHNTQFIYINNTIDSSRLLECVIRIRPFFSATLI
jgi:hypothetical protein